MPDRIAIVGVGGVFPGADDLDGFWRLITRGACAARTVPAGRWSLAPNQALAHGDPLPDTVASDRGCFVDHESLPIPDGAEGLDPLVRIGVAAARRAFADTRGVWRPPDRTGVIIGNIVLPTDHSSQLSQQVYGRALEAALFDEPGDGPAPVRVHDALSPGLPATVIARDLGLGGTAYTLDAACASSLYALKLACDELLAGRADAMLTGGLSRPSSLYTHMGFTQLKALAAEGICAPFDSAGKGLVIGEGAGMFVVKRIEDAIADGDHVYATVEGIGLSNDTAGSLLAPDSDGQVRAMQAAYAAAGWDPRSVDLIECHATGTPLGDAVEIEGLRRLWATQDWRPGQCVIGSVKSNVGHLLTAAGAAGLAKTILALRAKHLPPTANTRTPAPGLRLGDSPFRILSAGEDWPESPGRPRRAAVSAFGFGGINAHVLIEEWCGGPATSKARPTTRPTITAATRTSVTRTSDLAIVGRAARIGPWQSTTQVDRRLLGLDHTEPTTWVDPARVGGAAANAPRGFFVDALSVPIGRFRIPPSEFSAMLPQQLLMLLTTADAADDVGWQDSWGERSGAFVGVGLDMQTGAFHQRWALPQQARRWNTEHGLGLDDAALTAWVDQLREAVAPALDAGRTLGALGGIVASRSAREFRIGGPSFTLSAGEASGLKALEAAAHCLRSGIIDRALVAAVDLPADRFAAADSHHEPARELVAEGAVALVVRRLEDAVADGDRIYAVLPSDRSLRAPVAPDVTSRLGRSGAAQGLLEVYGAAMLVHRGLRNPNRPWLRDQSDDPRHFAVISGGDSVVVAEPPAPREPIQRDCWAMSGAAELPLLFTADTGEDLVRQLHAAAAIDDDLSALAQRLWRARDRRTRDPVRLGIAARDRAGLTAAIAHAQQLLTSTEPSDAVSQRRHGVYFSSHPLLAGQPDALAFVFPGSGNHALGMGRGLALAFPEIIAGHQRENTLLRSQLQPELFWDETDPSTLDERHEDLILGQVAFGTLSADALALLGIRPAAVLGYSLGESAALFGMRAWRGRDEMLRRVRESTLFSADMAGERRAVRAAWDLPAAAPTPHWRVGIVDRPAEVVSAVLADIERAYLLIINTPRECVIGGDPAAVEAAVEALGARFFPLPGITSVHCEVVGPVAARYRELHYLPTQAPADIRFYSGAAARPYSVDAGTAADALLNQALHGVDFLATVECAYADGARVFVEVGPGASCTRMVGEILRGRPFAAWSAADPARPESESLLRVALGLYAEGYPVDFAPLLARLDEAAQPVAVAPYRAARSIEVQRWRAPATVPAPPVATALTVPVALRPPDDEFGQLIADFEASISAHQRAHSRYLELSSRVTGTLAQAVGLQMQLAGAGAVAPTLPVFLDRAGCLEYAVGSIGNVLGTAFAEVDGFPTRVRLPDEPLMLVDRVLEIEAEPRSMGPGRLVTEHDVRPAAWYLDGERVSTCVAVEAGQADLLLSGYLGIDFETRGLAVYRLLDATVTFHRGLPTAGEVIRYEIVIDHFFRQGDAILFRFHFEATVAGAPLMTMRDGCAGFFTAADLAAGKGVVRTRLRLAPRPGIAPEGGAGFVRMATERYDDEAVDALRSGDLAACFGPDFAGLPLHRPRTIPGAQPGSLLRLLDRVTAVEPGGGRFGLGLIRAELDIHPQDWFLVCHFADDQVMPGTLMYECCMHTLRVFLLRLGWVGEQEDFFCEPKPGVDSQLRCRGQVVADTGTAVFEIEIKELGFGADPDGFAYAVADALMYADGKPIVEITNMSLQLTGLRRDRLQQIWAARVAPQVGVPLFAHERVLAHAVGAPSDAFGDRYRVFDRDRVLARLPGPPYLLVDRIVDIEGCRPWVLEAGGTVVAEYDVLADAWYFDHGSDDHGGEAITTMPFAVLLEIALQPCGWFAAYLGSALTSPVDLRFRNLGGTARQLRHVLPDTGTLTTRVRMTRVSSSGGMIIQNYEIAVYAGAQPVYVGDTYFGFFSRSALAEQIGIRDVEPYQPSSAERERSRAFPVLRPPGRHGEMLTMVDDIEVYVAEGGPAGFGFIRGVKRIIAQEWFFAAHFHQDPVWPGSLGLEAFLELLRIVARQRWGAVPSAPALGTPHEWVYRGQVLPTDREVQVEAWLTAVDDTAGTFTASGLLSVDGRVIYQMTDFEVRR